jgi:hypothetical protein
MTNGLRGALLDLGLHLGGRGRIVHDDAELPLMDEEPPRSALPIGVERDSLHRQVANVTPDNDAHNAKEPPRDVGAVLGAVLHTEEPKHAPLRRKDRKTS